LLAVLFFFVLALFFFAGFVVLFLAGFVFFFFAMLTFLSGCRGAEQRRGGFGETFS